jgi:hypothetical protein
MIGAVLMPRCGSELPTEVRILSRPNAEFCDLIQRAKATENVPLWPVSDLRMGKACPCPGYLTSSGAPRRSLEPASLFVVGHFRLRRPTLPPLNVRYAAGNNQDVTSPRNVAIGH